MLRLGQFHDFQLNAMLFGLLARCISCVALINEGEFDRLPSCLLHPTLQLAHLHAVLLVGRCDQQGQQIAQRIDCL